jgi:uncharacterized protein
MSPAEAFARGGLLLTLILGTAGCALRGNDFARPPLHSLPPGSPFHVTSLAAPDAWLRHHLMAGEHERALKILTPGSRDPFGDDLLRALQEALVLRQAGEFERSNERFAWAEDEIDRRSTLSVSRAAGSLILNDRVLPYLPGRGEAAMVPFYRMLNHLALADLEGALVEARRLSAQLGPPHSTKGAECRHDGALRYLAGLVFEAGGEQNDALVSLRQADVSFRSCGSAGGGAPDGFGADLIRLARVLDFEEVADYAVARYGTPAEPVGGTGEVLVLVEQGFVGHRREEALHVPIFPADIEELESGDVEGILRATASITARLANNFAERGVWGAAWDDNPATHFGYALRGAHVLRLSWPSFVEPDPAPVPMRLRVDDDSIAVHTLANLSVALQRDFEEGRPVLLARAVGRGLTKYLVSREAERQAEKRRGEIAGFLTGRLANLAANELERADVRSWSLLPDGLAIARVTLPEGSYRLRLETGSEEGSIVRDLGTVEIRAGELVVLGERIWPS